MNCNSKKLNKILVLTLILITMSGNLINNMNAQNNKQVNEKVQKLLSSLTLDEKISMLHGNSKFTIAGVERLGIPEWVMSDGPHGVREEIERDSWDPVGRDDDFSTYLPVGTALAATWNKDLAHKFGTVLGREARARNKDIILGPGINIHRTPLCGRNFEYMSEDPYLISKMVVPYIKGVQEQDVAACVKHYIANNQEYERFQVNAEIDERTLREIYLPGFKSAVVDGKALTVMSAYNKFRGNWCSENKYLLTDILKNEYGFEGVVISDWDGAHSTIKAANAGLDIEMGTDVNNYNEYFFADSLKKAVENGDVSIETINEKVKRILTAMFKSKVFDKNRLEGEYISKENFEIAKRVAEEAVVLLKNSNNILPLDKNKIKSIAVIGENATIKQASGGGSSGIKAKYEISPLEGLQNELGNLVKINYSQGYYSTTNFDWSTGVVDTSNGETAYREKLISDAISVAEKSDYVIMYLGLNHHYDMESVDRTEMDLPYYQDRLVQEVMKVNPNIIVVLIGGLPVDITKWVDDVPAILQGWYAGSEAGNVFAEILFGDVNPSGKLPFTFPKKLEDTPAFKFGDMPGNGLNVEYKEGIFVGYRYYDTFDVEPQFAFGHGLSYTTFSLSNIKINNKILTEGNKINVSVTLANTGDYDGSEIVQLYIEDVNSSVKRPHKELKEFKKVFLKQGERKEINFQIDESMLAFYDTAIKGFKAEAGQFKIHIGNSSDNIQLSAGFELPQNVIIEK